ncbi:hypothetical protein [Bacillus sp. NPDC060175]|uniref:hypothetical protein n=1 Tax=Bacillus sp. NPDC060175 TaxID=3347061 RepID=UPI0036666EB9
MLNKKTKTRCKECGHVAEVKKLSATKFGVYCKNIQCAKKTHRGRAVVAEY